MTAREVYDGTLIELNKVNAPTFTLEQWLYFANKAIQAYADKRYNFYAVNQQLTDDLRVLLSVYRVYDPAYTKTDTGETVLSFVLIDGLVPVTNTITVADTSELLPGDEIQFGTFTKVYKVLEVTDATTFVITPYWSFGIQEGGGGGGDPTGTVDGSWTDNLTGLPIYKIYKAFSEESTFNDNSIFKFNLDTANYYHTLAVRTYWTDTRAQLELDNNKFCDYNKIRSVSRMFPAKRLTYDMLANIENNSYLKPMYRQPYYLLKDNPLNLGTEKLSDTTIQYQNAPTIEVHAGMAKTGISIKMIEIDYLKLPEPILLTDEEVYSTVEDTSQLLEWPDYLKSNIIKIIVSYFLENVGNPRLQTEPMVNQDTPDAPIEMTGPSN